MHETLQPGQVHDLYHEAYMALLTFQIEDLTEKIGAITTAGGTRRACTYSFARNLVWKSCVCGACASIIWQMLAVMSGYIRMFGLFYQWNGLES